jgi:hypothetical protein
MIKRAEFWGCEKRSDYLTINDKRKATSYAEAKKVKKTGGLSESQVWKRCYSVCFGGCKKRGLKSYFKGFKRGLKAYLKNILKNSGFTQKFDVCFWVF